MSNKKLAEIVGKNIAVRRREIGITQEELGRKLGHKVLQDSISRLEHGKTEPRFSRLQALADILDCKVADLFREPESKAQEQTTRFADIIRHFSPQAQKQVVDMVEQMAKIIKEEKESI